MDGTKKLLAYMHGTIHLYIVSMAAAFLTNGFALLIPLLIRYAIDHIVGGLPVDNASIIGNLSGGTLWGIGGLLLAAALLRALFLFLKSYTAAYAAETVARNLKDRLLGHVLHAKYAFFSQFDSGDIIQRATADVETVRRFLAVQFVEIASILFMIAIISGLMVSLSPPLTLVALVLLPLIGLFSAFFFNRIKLKFREMDEADADLTSFMQEYLSGVTVVKAFGREIFEYHRFLSHNERYRQKVIELVRNFGSFWSLSDLGCYLQIGLVLYFGTLWAVAGRITLGTVVAFIAYENMILYPIRQLGRILSEFGKSVVAVDRIDEILAAEEDQSDPGDLTPEIFGEIEFQDVWFTYPDDRANHPVLKGLSFHVRAGETVGILGPTGSGKSTLMYLLTRLYEPDRGCILMDGQDIRTIDKRHLRQHVGLVLQETFLYSKSIGENIAIRGAPSRSKIIQAASMASIHQHIERFDDSYDTQVGERGITLSGGQRQRVAIARTLFDPVPVMVFDDSLSAVDTETDRKIRSALLENRSRSSIFLISHRMTTLMAADRILIMEDGQIVDQGTHAELIQRENLYQKIWDMQNQPLLEPMEGGEVHGFHSCG